MKRCEFIIDGEPKGKARPRFTRQGHAYTADATRNYEKLVSHAFDGEKFDGPVVVIISAYMQKAKSCKLRFPTKKPDVDNIAKIIMDGLNGTAWDDDKQVISVTVRKLWTPNYPRVEVTIKEVVE